MAMQYNKLRKLLNEGKPSTATRIWSPWPFMMETVASTHNFDYAEFVGEYAPFTQYDLENLARAAELHDMGSMIKVDFQSRGYVAQKAVASGFQSIMFTDHRTPEDVQETVSMMKSETPESGGTFGFPNRRFIGTQSHMPQLDHAKRVDDIVLCFMIEKYSAAEAIEEICSIKGVDMVQFGPSDYSMSRGWNRSDHVEDTKAAERRMIKIALDHKVQPRCEIKTVEAAKYYIDLGVRHFCLGDQMAKLRSFWIDDGAKMRELADSL